MPTSARLALTAAALLLAPLAIAQPDTAKQPDAAKPTAPERKTTKQPQKKETAKDSNKPAERASSYPPTPAKDLNATNDFRNRPAPALKVEKWLSKEPKREGKTVLIDFWATWCGPCRKLIPELKDWQKKYESDLVIIGVSNEEASKVQNFIRAQQVNYAMAVDTKSTTSNEIGISGIPHVLVISSDGVVRWQGFPGGADPLTEEKLEQIIKADKAARLAKEAEKKTADAAPKDPKPAASKPPVKKN
jgi:cytochrome c biogenesis protein CcmG, thiol:disulfide interchange protein DsbE